MSVSNFTSDNGRESIQLKERDRRSTLGTSFAGSSIKDENVDVNLERSTPSDEILDSVIREVTNVLSDDGLPDLGFNAGHQQQAKGKKWCSSRVQFREDSEEEEEQDGITVISPPPPGHGYDFFSILKSRGHYKDTDQYFPDQKLQVLDKERLISKAVALIAPKARLLPSNKDNRDWSKRGIRFMDLISKVPLSKVWHRTTQILAMIVFIVNVIVAFYDIVRDFLYLHYKVPALILTLLENAILLIMWLVMRRPYFQRNGERSLKHQQYIENIVHEILLYPLLAMAAFGFATEKMYQTPEDAFGWAQLILLVIDVLELIWTQIVRLRMTYKIFTDIEAVIKGTQSTTVGCCKWNTAGWVLLRTYITTIGNIFTFLALLAMLILQVHYDNRTSGDYRITWRSGILLLCFMLLPLYSILVYVLANAFWAMEILLMVNVNVGQDTGFQEALAKQYGPIVSDALTLSMSKVQSNQEKLHEIKETYLIKKIVYGALEPLNAFLLVIWQILVITSLIILIATDVSSTNAALQIFFSLMLLIANWHVFFVAIVADIIVIGCLIGAMFYPMCIAVCCKETYIVRSEKAEDLRYF